jgi:hypothetical protein
MDNPPSVPKAADPIQNLKQQYANDGGNPLGEIFIEVLDAVGGMDYLIEFAEDHPTQFIPILLRLMPVASASSQSSGGVHLHVHPSLQAGPLDIVAEQ